MLYDPKWEAPATTKPPDDPGRALLLKAANMIETHGWIQGAASNGHGFCALGAICLTGENYCAAIDALHRIVPQIMDWNDAPGRTKEEVIATLRKAAE